MHFQKIGLRSIFLEKKKYANKVAAIGCIKRLKDDKEADKNAKE